MGIKYKNFCISVMSLFCVTMFSNIALFYPALCMNNDKTANFDQNKRLLQKINVSLLAVVRPLLNNGFKAKLEKEQNINLITFYSQTDEKLVSFPLDGGIPTDAQMYKWSGCNPNNKIDKTFHEKDFEGRVRELYLYVAYIENFISMATKFKKWVEDVCQFLVDIYLRKTISNELCKKANILETDKFDTKFDKLKKYWCDVSKQQNFKLWNQLYWSAINASYLQKVMLNGEKKGLFHKYFDTIRDTWSEIEKFNFYSAFGKVEQVSSDEEVNKEIVKRYTQEILKNISWYTDKVDSCIKSLKDTLQSKDFNDIDKDISTTQEDYCIDFYLHLLGFYNKEYSYNELDQSKFVGWIVSNKTVLNSNLEDEDLSKFPLSNSSNYKDYATWQFYHSFFNMEYETEKQLARVLVKDLLRTQTGKMLIYSSLLNRARVDFLNKGKYDSISRLVDDVLSGQESNINYAKLTEPNPVCRYIKQTSIAFTSSISSQFSPATQCINISLENDYPVLTESEILTSLVHELVHSLQTSGYNANLLTTTGKSTYSDFLNFSYGKELVDMYLGNEFRLEHCYDVVDSDYSLVINCLNEFFNLGCTFLKTSELHQLYNEFLLYMSDLYSSFGSVGELIAVNGYFGTAYIYGKPLCENLFRYEIGRPIRNNHLPDIQSRYNNGYWSDEKADGYEEILNSFFEKRLNSISGTGTTKLQNAVPSRFKTDSEKYIEFKDGELKAIAYGHKYHIKFNKMYEHEDLANLDQFKILRIHSLIDKKCPNTEAYPIDVLVDILKQANLESFLITKLAKLANNQNTHFKLDVVKFFHAKSAKDSPFYELAKRIVDNNELTEKDVIAGVEILKNYLGHSK